MPDGMIALFDGSVDLEDAALRRNGRGLTTIRSMAQACSDAVEKVLGHTCLLEVSPNGAYKLENYSGVPSPHPSGPTRNRDRADVTFVPVAISTSACPIGDPVVVLHDGQIRQQGLHSRRLQLSPAA